MSNPTPCTPPGTPVEVEGHPQLGDQARDAVSGFTGTVTGTCQHLGCEPETQITAELASDGSLRVEWFPQVRVVRLGHRPPSASTEPAADQPTPEAVAIDDDPYPASSTPGQ